MNSIRRQSKRFLSINIMKIDVTPDDEEDPNCDVESPIKRQDYIEVMSRRSLQIAKAHLFSLMNQVESVI